MKKLLQIYINKRFYSLAFAIAFLLVCGRFWLPVFIIAKILLYVFIALILIDILLLLKGNVKANRDVAVKLSNGDFNDINYQVESQYHFPVTISVIDELPIQFQHRTVLWSKKCAPNQAYQFTHKVRPVTRGKYFFGKMRLMVQTVFGLLSLRYSIDNPFESAVYPSFIQLRNMELMAFSFNKTQQNNQKYRLPGNSKEFEQIKEYVVGDDYRRLNWKATARHNKLMVNEYQEERSRHIYQLIDMGRTMKMPFEDMTLLDYSINATLALSNIILKKHDRCGLFTYSSKVHSIIKSDNRQQQLNKILETLYAQETAFNESNLEQVFTLLEKNTQGRSMLIFYTNFESNPSLERQLPILKKLAKRHLVLLVTFVNTELEKMTEQKVSDIEELYQKALAGNHLLQKSILMDQLLHYGILHLKVRPNELTPAVINKYLEIKDRGLI